MFGFFVGAACLVALARTLRGGRWAHGWAHGGGWGRRHGWDGPGGWSGPGGGGRDAHDARDWRSWDGGGRPGARGPLRWLFHRLGTSPGQETVLAEAAEAVREAMGGWRDDWREARADVARSLRPDTFDGSALDAATARTDARMTRMRETLRTQLARVHEALDPRQRAVLADLLAAGPRGWGR